VIHRDLASEIRRRVFKRSMLHAFCLTRETFNTGGLANTTLELTLPNDLPVEGQFVQSCEAILNYDNSHWLRLCRERPAIHRAQNFLLSDFLNLRNQMKITKREPSYLVVPKDVFSFMANDQDWLRVLAPASTVELLLEGRLATAAGIFIVTETTHSPLLEDSEVLLVSATRRAGLYSSLIISDDNEDVFSIKRTVVVDNYDRLSVLRSTTTN
jgi:hypothetical protein